MTLSNNEYQEESRILKKMDTELKEIDESFHPYKKNLKTMVNFSTNYRKQIKSLREEIIAQRKVIINKNKENFFKFIKAKEITEIISKHPTIIIGGKVLETRKATLQIQKDALYEGIPVHITTRFSKLEVVFQFFEDNQLIGDVLYEALKLINNKNKVEINEAAAYKIAERAIKVMFKVRKISLENNTIENNDFYYDFMTTKGLIQIIISKHGQIVNTKKIKNI